MKPTTITSCLEGLDKDLRGKLNYRETQIKKIMAEGKRVLFDLGKELSDARDDCQEAGSETTFTAWLSEKFDLSKATAYRAIAIWERFGASQRETPQRLNFVGFDDTALYELAKTETPEGAVKDALKIAKKGGRLTIKACKELIAEWTVEQESDDDEAGDADTSVEQVSITESSMQPDDRDNEAPTTKATPAEKPGRVADQMIYYVSELQTGIDHLAEINGGRGDEHANCMLAISELLLSLNKMKGGER